MRELPSVDAVLRSVPELDTVGHSVARWLVRREIAAARGGADLDVRAAVAAAARALHERRLRRVINATGVVLHTNLGRAPLSDAAREALLDAMGATTVEFDVARGARGVRAPVAATLAAALCDAEDALIVNNNAAALLLALAALAHGREVIVSRGELIEIGGEFRLPDVMAASGALLKETGTTNRTRAEDYRRALTPATALLLRVHPSNYRIVGFTETPSVSDLAAVARDAGVPLLFDVGSGLLAPMPGIDEPDATSALADGADLICFSGDKLLGGPQAGVLAGRADLIERCRRHPIARAVRADKLTLAALEATLWAHAQGEDVPVSQMLSLERAEIEARAKQIVASIGFGEVIAGTSVPGGGSLPGHELPTALIAVSGVDLAARLRAHDTPVIARIEDGMTVLDLRTVDLADDETIVDALRNPAL